MIIDRRRNQLEIYEGEVHRFTGEFGKIGMRHSYKSGGITETVLLTNIKDDKGNPVAQHLWVSMNFQLRIACNGLSKYDEISFEGYVKRFLKGIKAHRYGVRRRIEEDFTIISISNIKKLGRCEIF